MKRDVLDVALELLDHEVVDAAGVPCGVVDDVELEGGAGKPLRVAALLIGPGALANRLARPFDALARRAFGNAQVSVPWSEIHAIAERVTLRHAGQTYGLGTVDRKWRRVIAGIPGAS